MFTDAAGSSPARSIPRSTSSAGGARAGPVPKEKDGPERRDESV